MDRNAILVIGAGSWGTALALCLARHGRPVHLWGNVQSEMEAMQKERVNRFYLPNFPFPDGLKAYVKLEEAFVNVRDVFLVVPSHVFRQVLQNIKPYLNKNSRIVWGKIG